MPDTRTDAQLVADIGENCGYGLCTPYEVSAFTELATRLQEARESARVWEKRFHAGARERSEADAALTASREALRLVLYQLENHGDVWESILTLRAVLTTPKEA
jgi:hypothetical protein